jgi:ABC-type nickel/cobalt efflux system permease component RcnA
MNASLKNLLPYLPQILGGAGVLVLFLGVWSTVHSYGNYARERDFLDRIFKEANDLAARKPVAAAAEKRVMEIYHEQQLHSRAKDRYEDNLGFALGILTAGLAVCGAAVFLWVRRRKQA